MKKAIVKEEACIACGACNAIAPEVFEIDEATGLSIAVKNDDNNENNEEVVSALESCPTQAIVFVDEKDVTVKIVLANKN